jgi:hypothetical protein
MACEAEVHGQRCEEMAAEICCSLGFDVRPSPARHYAWDLLINNMRVQVKKRTTRASRPNRIEMKTSNRGKGFSYAECDLDAFAVLCDGVWFVFPVSAICSSSGFVPNDIDIRTVMQFRDAWHILHGGTVSIDRQLGFDF